MELNEKVMETLKKKAFGFSYSEEVLEFEEVSPQKPLFCEKRKRIYLGRGYLKVFRKNKGLEVYPKIKFKIFEKSCHYFLKNGNS